jgi:hypothetical protein
MLSKIYLQLGQFEKAREEAAKAHTSKANHPEILLQLALSSAQLPYRAEETVRWIRELLSLPGGAPQEPQLRRLLLAKSVELKQPALALEALEGPAEGVTEEGAAQIRASVEAEMAK